jgi:hypothetical protein
LATAATADPGRHPRSKAKQLPGMSAHDVNEAAKCFDRISYDIELFTRSMRALNQNNGAVRTRASVLRLAKHLKITDPLLNDLTREESAALQKAAREPTEERPKGPYRSGSYTVTSEGPKRVRDGSVPKPPGSISSYVTYVGPFSTALNWIFRRPV